MCGAWAMFPESDPCPCLGRGRTAAPWEGLALSRAPGVGLISPGGVSSPGSPVPEAPHVWEVSRGGGLEATEMMDFLGEKQVLIFTWTPRCE